MPTATKRKPAAELLGAPPIPKTGRDRLVWRAIDLFYTHGFRAVGLDQILEASGVTKTTFYKHFDSLDDLWVAAIETRDHWESAAWARAIKRIGGDDPVAQLRAVFDVLDTWFNDPSFLGCMFINAATEFADPREPAHQAAAAYKIKARNNWCEMARRAGASDPDAFADLYTALVEGTLIMRHVHRRNDAARITKPLIEQLIAKHIPSAKPA